MRVCIDSEGGQFSVGVEPEGGDAAAPAPAGGDAAMAAVPADGGQGIPAPAGDSYMKPARSLDDALAQAKQLLMADQQDPQAEAAFQAGFAGARDTSGMNPQD